MKRGFLIFLVLLSLNIFAQDYKVTTITADDVYTEEITNKESYISKRFKYSHPLDWNKGMRFLAVSRTFGNWSSLRSKDSDKLLNIEDYVWKVFTYQGYEEQKNEIIFLFECEGKTYYESISRNGVNELREESLNYIPTFDNLVYIDELDYLRESLSGRLLYIKTNKWYRDMPDGISQEYIHGKKHIRVEINDVGVNTDPFIKEPIKVIFTPEGMDKKFAVYISLSGINSKSSINDKLITFDELFGFGSEWYSYLEISADDWENVKRGKLFPGMTRKACALAVGDLVLYKEMFNHTYKVYLNGHFHQRANDVQIWRVKGTERYLIFVDNLYEGPYENK